ncbi:double-strand break repair helicase AddA [Boseongicola aestuarii]|uniref:DNA 3'-5' helicase n=1 Tax=Boseongicola aestuarii TaxID=1470561 RepID=A0A238J2P8_9RHOB|nr:double-strand break repair helicase AddA [Boseongicola aestuarii]SMX24999.1 ATP-dependent helicase/nuclease subunit A [Boseongicola aestuarii]
MTKLTDASIAQNRAADPNASTWLSANAGSGKTRVLTDRVARLLLHGTNPQSILCLTYTKAAATEMQNRLFKRLGEWSMLDDNALRAGLSDLGEDSPPSLDQARTLFARAIETPGGLKIQTIHSFCAALLRQFPVEAGVSTQFRELDDIARAEIFSDVLDGLAKSDAPSLKALISYFTGESLVELAVSIAGSAENFLPAHAPPPSRQDIFEHMNADPQATHASILNATLTLADLQFLKSLPPILAQSAKPTDTKLGEWLADLPQTPSYRLISALESKFLFGPGTKAPFTAKTSSLPTKGFRNGPFAPHASQLQSIMETLEENRPARVAFEAANKTHALHAFAADLIPAYTAAKTARGVLDFDDLITKARDLLTDEGLAWVLYRLDGGIDHILVDEAQDTSPTQWQVIKALSAEITAGEGARPDRSRTIFAVGDKKQSIYSFQGADARRFDTTAAEFATKLKDAGKLVREELVYSFRSSPAILSAVDHTFQDGADGLGGAIEHRAFNETLPGRVDLWDLQPRPNTPEHHDWHNPVDRLSADSPTVKLAERIARKITAITQTVSIQEENGKIRPATAGDVLILVQGRGQLFDNIIAACKSANLPIAGADRLKISAELAVRDLLALLSFLALPEDDLSLATALRSPLFGWGEQDLFSLAQPRKGYLWQALRENKADHPETHARLDRLRKDADFQRPFELLELILTRHGGRKALMARLGPEAEDGINELLNQAILYEQQDVPSLTGFVTRASASDVDIKRQSETSGDLIRVMTVHGAKGLEAPIVILPDTMRDDRASRDAFVIDSSDMPVWNVAQDVAPDGLADAKDAQKASDAEERQRLLYVAMTRAKNWLIVGGVEKASGEGDNRWHKAVAEGLLAAGAKRVIDDEAEILRLEFGAWPAHIPSEKLYLETFFAQTPALFYEPVKPRTPKPKPLNPSKLGGAKIVGGTVDDALSQAAMQRGTDIHLLLEALPALPEETWEAAALRLLPNAADRGDLLNEARQSILSFPEVFAPDSLAEVDLSASLPTLDGTLAGTVDRLIIAEDHVLAVDFKTNQIVPDTAETTPDGLLRQMAAYLEALEQIFPSHRIDLAILWTATPSLTHLPHGIVRPALARATTS